MDALSLEWQKQALCPEVELDIFFPHASEDHAPAKRICRQCPVIDDCLNYALETDQSHGVWGGWSPRQRRIFLNNMG